MSCKGGLVVTGRPLLQGRVVLQRRCVCHVSPEITALRAPSSELFSLLTPSSPLLEGSCEAKQDDTQSTHSANHSHSVPSVHELRGGRERKGQDVTVPVFVYSLHNAVYTCYGCSSHRPSTSKVLDKKMSPKQAWKC